MTAHRSDPAPVGEPVPTAAYPFSASSADHGPLSATSAATGSFSFGALAPGSGPTDGPAPARPGWPSDSTGVDPAGFDPAAASSGRSTNKQLRVTLPPLERIKAGIIVVVLIVAVATLVTALLAPAREIPDPAVMIQGNRLVACPVGEAPFGETTVRAVGGDLTWSGLGQTMSEPGTALEQQNPAGPLVISGDQGLGAVTTAAQSGQLVAAVCAPPVATGWWDGVWASETQRSTFLLTNIDPTEAIVSLTLYGSAGVIEAHGLREIEIQRFSTRVISLATFGVSAEKPIAVVLNAERGRVAAVLRSEGDYGLDWRQSSTAPATELVLPAIPASPGDNERFLFITNHGSQRAQVSVLGLTSGAGVPLAGDQEMAGGAPTGNGPSIAPHSTTLLELTQALVDQNVGLKLLSNQPITASFIGTGADMASVSAQPGVAGGATIPVIPDATLTVTNPMEETAILYLSYRDAAGIETASEEIEVPAGSQTLTFDAADGSLVLTTTSTELRLALIVTKVGETEGLAVAPIGLGSSLGLNVVVGYDSTLG